MEEIEYLEEYEDLILPAISTTTSGDLNKNTTKTCTNIRGMASTIKPPDEGSSSIDQDIFESLFDDNSDDDVLPSKRIIPQLCQRREGRASLDSLDMLVKDLVGEQLVQSTDIKIDQPMNSGVGSKTAIKSQSTTATKERNTSANPDREVCIKSKMPVKSKLESVVLDKPKSVATVRPTIQNQDRKHLMKSNVSSFDRSVTSHVSTDGASSSGRLFGSPGTRAHNAAITSDITSGAAAGSIKTNAQENIVNRPTTIIKAKKLCICNESAEDPLSFDDDYEPASDSSHAFSDVSDDSLASVSDLTELSEHLSMLDARDPSSKKLTMETTASTFVAAQTGFKKTTLKQEVPGAEIGMDINVEGNKKNTTEAESDLNVTSSVLEITKNLPEKVTIISDTLLTRIDTALLESIRNPTTLKHASLNAISTSVTKNYEDASNAASETLQINSQSTTNLLADANVGAMELARLSPDLDNVAFTEEVAFSSNKIIFDVEECKNTTRVGSDFDNIIVGSFEEDSSQIHDVNLKNEKTITKIVEEKLYESIKSNVTTEKLDSAIEKFQNELKCRLSDSKEIEEVKETNKILDEGNKLGTFNDNVCSLPESTKNYDRYNESNVCNKTEKDDVIASEAINTENIGCTSQSTENCIELKKIDDLKHNKENEIVAQTDKEINNLITDDVKQETKENNKSSRRDLTDETNKESLSNEENIKANFLNENDEKNEKVSKELPQEPACENSKENVLDERPSYSHEQSSVQQQQNPILKSEGGETEEEDYEALIKPKNISKRRNQWVDNDWVGIEIDEPSSVAESTVQKVGMNTDGAQHGGNFSEKNKIEMIEGKNIPRKRVKVQDKSNSNENEIVKDGIEEKQLKGTKEQIQMDKSYKNNAEPETDVASCVHSEAERVKSSAEKSKIELVRGYGKTTSDNISVDKTVTKNNDKMYNTNFDEERDTSKRCSLRKRCADSSLLLNANANLPVVKEPQSSLGVAKDNEVKVASNIPRRGLRSPFGNDDKHGDVESTENKIVKGDIKRKSVRLRNLDASDTSESEIEENKRLKRGLDNETQNSMDKRRKERRDKNMQRKTTENDGGSTILSTTPKSANSLNKTKITETVGKQSGEPPSKILRLENRDDFLDYRKHSHYSQQLNINKNGEELMKSSAGEFGGGAAITMSRKIQPVKPQSAAKTSPDKSPNAVMTFNEWLKRQRQEKAKYIFSTTKALDNVSITTDVPSNANASQAVEGHSTLLKRPEKLEQKAEISEEENISTERDKTRYPATKSTDKVVELTKTKKKEETSQAIGETCARGAQMVEDIKITENREGTESSIISTKSSTTFLKTSTERLLKSFDKTRKSSDGNILKLKTTEKNTPKKDSATSERSTLSKIVEKPKERSINLIKPKSATPENNPQIKSSTSSSDVNTEKLSKSVEKPKGKDSNSTKPKSLTPTSSEINTKQLSKSLEKSTEKSTNAIKPKSTTLENNPQIKSSTSSSDVNTEKLSKSVEKPKGKDSNSTKPKSLTPTSYEINTKQLSKSLEKSTEKSTNAIKPKSTILENNPQIKSSISSSDVNTEKLSKSVEKLKGKGSNSTKLKSLTPTSSEINTKELSKSLDKPTERSSNLTKSSTPKSIENQREISTYSTKPKYLTSEKNPQPNSPSTSSEINAKELSQSLDKPTERSTNLTKSSTPEKKIPQKSSTASSEISAEQVSKSFEKPTERSTNSIKTKSPENIPSTKSLTAEKKIPQKSSSASFEISAERVSKSFEKPTERSTNSIKTKSPENIPSTKSSTAEKKIPQKSSSASFEISAERVSKSFEKPTERSTNSIKPKSATLENNAQITSFTSSSDLKTEKISKSLENPRGKSSNSTKSVAATSSEINIKQLSKSLEKPTEKSTNSTKTKSLENSPSTKSSTPEKIPQKSSSASSKISTERVSQSFEKPRENNTNLTKSTSMTLEKDHPTTVTTPSELCAERLSKSVVKSKEESTNPTELISDDNVENSIIVESTGHALRMLAMEVTHDSTVVETIENHTEKEKQKQEAVIAAQKSKKQKKTTKRKDTTNGNHVENMNNPPKSTAKTQRVQKKREVEVLFDSMSKEMKESNHLQLLLNDSDKQMVTKRKLAYVLAATAKGTPAKDNNSTFFKKPSEPESTRNAVTQALAVVSNSAASKSQSKPIKNILEKSKPSDLIKKFKCRKLRVRINRSVVKKYLIGLRLQNSQENTTELPSNFTPEKVQNRRLNVPLHVTRASCRTPAQVQKPGDDTPLNTIKSSSSSLSTEPSKSHESISTRLRMPISSAVPTALHKSIPVPPNQQPPRTAYSMATRLRSNIVDRTNVFTITEDNNRPPASTLSTDLALSNSPCTRGRPMDDDALLPGNCDTSPFLLNEVEATIRSEVENTSTLDSASKTAPKQTKTSIVTLGEKNKSAIPKSSDPKIVATSVLVSASALPVEDATPTPLNSLSANISVQATPVVILPTNTSSIYTPVKEELLDEVHGAQPITETTENLSNTAIDIGFGVTPSTLDENGTRLYTFLHPAKYNRTHGNVLLDYCCPNLDGPMTAIDPTRIHAQVPAAVRDLPAHIVMTTKLITRADLQTNKTAIPASIRQKVEKITNANSGGGKNNARASASAQFSGANADVNPSVVPIISATSTPTLPPTVTALQKHLPATTVIMPKATTGGATSAPASNSHVSLPPLTPFSAFANVSHQPATSLSDGQRSVLRANLRRFDALLRKHYHRIAVLNFVDRQRIIENIIQTNNVGGGYIFLPKDVDNAVRLLEAYAHQMQAITSTSNILVTSASLTPSSESITFTNSNCTRKKTTSTVASSSTMYTSSCSNTLPVPSGKVNTPIYDDERNIIGWQLQVATVPLTTTTGAITKSTMSTRSDGPAVASNAQLSVKRIPAGTAASVSKNNSPAVTALKQPAQESPRIFYTKPPLQTSTPVASNSGGSAYTPAGKSSSLSSSSMTPSYLTKHPTRLTRALPLQQLCSSTSTSTNVTTTTTKATVTSPTNSILNINSNPQVLTSKASSITTFSKSVTVMRSSTRTTRNSAAVASATASGPTSSSKTTPKIIVISNNIMGNSIPQSDESILPDNDNAPTAEIKRERVDEDFIRGN